MGFLISPMFKVYFKIGILLKVKFIELICLGVLKNTTFNIFQIKYGNIQEYSHTGHFIVRGNMRTVVRCL